MPLPVERLWSVGRVTLARLNRALDAVAERFGEKAVTRGMARAEGAAPSTRIK